MYDIFGHVVDGVFEVEPISVTEDWAIDAILEANLLNLVSKTHLFVVVNLDRIREGRAGDEV